MSNVVLRAGRSGVLNRAKDLSCAIVTADGELLSAADSLPIHVLSGPDLMAKAMMSFHPELRPGDAFLHNSPYHGCSHAADHTILAPVIDAEGVHRFTVVVKAHQADIGNSAPTTYFATAKDVYEEGALLFPAVRVQSNYQDIDDIIRMCRLRIRVPNQWYGDYLAMVGAARAGEQELLALGAEIGWDVISEFQTQWLEYSRTRMLEAIAKLPEMVSSGQSHHDPMFGTPPTGVDVAATVVISPNSGRITVDLRDNIAAMNCGLNVSEACAKTAAMIGVFNCLDAEIPKNAGSFSCIDVLIEDGSAIGGAKHPNSLSVSTTNLADRVVAAVHMALSKIVPEQAVAEIGAVNPPHKGVISGTDPRTKTPFINQLFLGSTGGPASSFGDGWLTYSHAGNAGISFVESVEMTEMHHPLRILCRELVPDSEGAGCFTGAPCLEVEFQPTLSPMTLAYVSDGTFSAAQGVCGGLAGSTAAQHVRDEAGHLNEIAPVGQMTVKPQQSILSRTAAGGGYGDPLDRECDQVLQDLASGLLTLERAESIYGVVAREGVLDERATAKLRTVKGSNENAGSDKSTPDRLAGPMEATDGTL
ncbi:hydantoinase B/oxoprolinase family protein [Sinorhizobium chiapasense]|uniref:Hydantoinase B/oxoprolinase family protein n=1 Tax=Sinorhizobium chiapasense TaxID=501572 RepID=A0ABZ2BJN1_9HYPH